MDGSKLCILTRTKHLSTSLALASTIVITGFLANTAQAAVVVTTPVGGVYVGGTPYYGYGYRHGYYGYGYHGYGYNTGYHHGYYGNTAYHRGYGHGTAVHNGNVYHYHR